MKWAIYNAVFSVGYVLAWPRYLLRMWRRGGYGENFMHRFARYSPETRRRLHARSRVWVHGVSVGEMFVVLRLIEELRRVRPGLAFVVSTTTSTGYRVAKERVHADDVLIYYPLDFPWTIRRALNRITPRALLIAETELWPNMIRTARRRGIPVALFNGRVSNGSYRGYRKVRVFFRDVLQAMDLLSVQSDQDRDRLIDLGAPPERIRVAGSAKYDDGSAAGVDRAGVEARLRENGVDPKAPLLLGGSTWDGEERILIGIYQRLKAAVPGLRLILVPRHAERGSAVEAEIRAAGLMCWKRSDSRKGLQPPAGFAPDVLLVDTTGELKSLYSVATVIFVGKSLTQHGGQNLIEPAMFGKPVVVGPNMENFQSVMHDFLHENAVVQVPDAEGLEATLRDLLTDVAGREALGRRASAVVESKRGAVQRTVDWLLPLISDTP
jgi:3-deoxy-D-manno-octulosonic-acid transferase